nr:MAG TPA: Lysozyme [Bacteriophage sp.]
MKTSQKCVDFIKRMEGFLKYPVWDYAQYSVGYGCRCGKDDYPNGITEEEAERLLKKELANAEAAVNRFGSYRQQQFDALVSFSYNVGAGWMQNPNYQIYQLAKGAKYSDAEVLSIFKAWNHAGGKELPGLTKRREAEARMWLYGENSGGEEENEMRYEKLKDIKNKEYRATLDKLIENGTINGKSGSGEDLVIDLGEDAVRLLVMLERAGVL